MKSRHLRHALSLLVLMLAASPQAAPADTIVLDGDDVTDWVRVFSSSTWKQKDSCLHPNSLLKFNLSQLPVTSDIIEARLHLFVERVQPGTAIDLWHVADDSWSYAWTEPDEVWNWPVWDLIGTTICQDTVSLSMDVRTHLIEEAQSGSRVLSIKIAPHDFWYQPIRISSPLAPLERMRPRIVVTYLGPVVPPALPDLAVTQSDIGMEPMRPTPGQTVTLRARVRNIGASGASNVPVAFYDGEPWAGSPPVGIWIVPYLAPGGGSDVASTPWTCVRGLREIYAVADFEGAISETDEANNADLRPLLITDPQEYSTWTESFEHSGRVTYHGDFDVPKQFEYAGPKSFYVNSSGGEAYSGHRAMELYLDGTADDGTIWVETVSPALPDAYADVQVEFELFRYSADIAFQPVVAVTLFDPEMEGDFTVLAQGSAAGWTLHSFHKLLATGPYDMVHVAVGLTCTWETPGTFYIDQIRTRVTALATQPVDDGSLPDVPTSLLRSWPNPAEAEATIAYHLESTGPVTLQVFDAAGRLLRTLLDEPQQVGFHRIRWNGTDGSGRALPSGVYFYRLRTRDREEGRSLLLAR